MKELLKSDSNKSMLEPIYETISNKSYIVNIKEIIDAIKKDFQLSQAEISRLAGVSQTAISNWIQRGTANPSTVKHLLDNLPDKQNNAINVETDKLKSLINQIKDLGYTVQLTPIYA
jgi:DNA-binding transcriptional regulator YiaG